MMIIEIMIAYGEPYFRTAPRSYIQNEHHERIDKVLQYDDDLIVYEFRFRLLVGRRDDPKKISDRTMTIRPR